MKNIIIHTFIKIDKLYNKTHKIYYTISLPAYEGYYIGYIIIFPIYFCLITTLHPAKIYRVKNCLKICSVINTIARRKIIIYIYIIFAWFKKSCFCETRFEFYSSSV